MCLVALLIVERFDHAAKRDQIKDIVVYEEHFSLAAAMARFIRILLHRLFVYRNLIFVFLWLEADISMSCLYLSWWTHIISADSFLAYDVKGQNLLSIRATAILVWTEEG